MLLIIKTVLSKILIYYCKYEYMRLFHSLDELTLSANSSFYK